MCLPLYCSLVLWNLCLAEEISLSDKCVSVTNYDLKNNLSDCDELSTLCQDVIHLMSDVNVKVMPLEEDCSFKTVLPI